MTRRHRELGLRRGRECDWVSLFHDQLGQSARRPPAAPDAIAMVKARFRLAV